MPAYDENGFDENGFDRHGFNRNGYNRNGYNADGYDADGYDASGYDEDGYDSTGEDADGFDREGFDSDGYDRDGYDENGWDRDGYNSDGEHVDGNFADALLGYSTNVIERCRWSGPAGSRELLAGHEVEMYSPSEDRQDVEETTSQVNAAYAKAPREGYTTNGQASIAKHDGSLDDGGFECVTVPMTARQTYAVFESFTELGGGGCAAWDYGDEVGHHIHVSRAAISPLTLGKLGVFMNVPFNRPFLTYIAQRPADYNGFERNKKITRPENYERHSVLNITDRTAEFRLFKSSLASASILKNYEFAISAVRFCRHTANTKVNWRDYLRYVADHRKTYLYLHDFLVDVRDPSGYWSDFYLSILPKNARKVFKKRRYRA